MTNTKLFLLIGTSLSLIPCFTSAQCVATQDCATLGYTETSCSGGIGVKCPFGNKWACFKTDAEVCQQEGFTKNCTGAGQQGKGESCANLYKQCDCQDAYKYTCSGEGYAGGSGTACGGKYAECTCAEGYGWKDGLCVKLVCVQWERFKSSSYTSNCRCDHDMFGRDKWGCATYCYFHCPEGSKLVSGGSVSTGGSEDGCPSSEKCSYYQATCKRCMTYDFPE